MARKICINAFVLRSHLCLAIEGEKKLKGKQTNHFHIRTYNFVFFLPKQKIALLKWDRSRSAVLRS